MNIKENAKIKEEIKTIYFQKKEIKKWMLPNTFIYYFYRLNCRLVAVNSASFIKLRILLSVILFVTSYRQFLSFSCFWLVFTAPFLYVDKESVSTIHSFFCWNPMFSCRIVFLFWSWKQPKSIRNNLIYKTKFTCGHAFIFSFFSTHYQGKNILTFLVRVYTSWDVKSAASAFMNIF